MSKSHPLRVRHGDYYFIKGNVLDIGCGPDPIKLDPPSTVRGWDLPDGDAQYLASIEDKTFDCIVSAHCLEHVMDPAIALQNWSRVLKEGGCIYALVPLYSAYEKFRDFKFGSPHAARFNPDHKTSWDIVSCQKPINHEHFDYKRIVEIGKQAGLHLVDLRLELDGFHWEHWKNPDFDSTMHGGLAQLCIIYQKI